MHDVRGWIFENHTLKLLNIPFKKVVLPGRVKCGGTEGEIVVAHGCRKTKMLICGTEEEILVAHGRLPSPAHYQNNVRYFPKGIFLSANLLNVKFRKQLLLSLLFKLQHLVHSQSASTPRPSQLQSLTQLQPAAPQKA